jgi:hypothetical protein
MLVTCRRLVTHFYCYGCAVEQKTHAQVHMMIDIVGIVVAAHMVDSNFLYTHLESYVELMVATQRQNMEGCFDQEIHRD